jgi:aubergine-like protein
MSERRRDFGGVGSAGPSSARDPIGRPSERSQQPHGKFQIIPTKPATCVTKIGDVGEKVQLSANYFEFKQGPSFDLNQYNVNFQPPIEDKSTRVYLISQQRELLGSHIYDGSNILYTFHYIKELKPEFRMQSKDGSSYVLRIAHQGKIEMSSPEALQVMNIILRRTMKGLDLQLVGRHLFDAKAAIKVNQFDLELWPGFITSIRNHEVDTLMCCEVSHRVMRNETVMNLMQKLRNQDSANFVDNFKREIIGATVLTAYNNRTYRIDDVNTNVNPNFKFKLKNNREMTIADYYKEKYNITIKSLTQPLLVSKPSKKDLRDGRKEDVLLVPELCRLTGITPEMRGNFQMMRALASHTQLKPDDRVKALRELSQRLRSTAKCNDVLKGASLQLNKDVVSFEGRKLMPETILFGNDRTYTCDNRVDWTQQFRNNSMYNDSPLNNWAMIFPSSLSDAAKGFVELLRKVGSSMNYNIEFPTHKKSLNNPRADDYRDAINEIAQKKPSLIFIVIQNLNAQLYSMVKQLTCVTHAIPSQVVLGKTISPSNKGVMSIATKVAIQLNCKLGGAPWMVKFPIMNTMTVGFDVTHDTRDKRKSIGAFVATMDLKKEVKFFSAVIEHQTGGQEMSSNLSKTLGRAIESYVKLHGVLPERLFFYRDGVGDGQIEHVQQIELTEIKEMLKKLRVQHKDDNALKLTFIIVNKRINTRIFLRSQKFDNPQPGTVVDTTITLPERYDFYLVSQSVRIGTVTPTSYNVIEDENILSPGKLQTLTYKNCHLYYNWSGTVRVPAVVQYAHKLAFLVGQHMHAIPTNEMGEKGSLYFL